jgi:HEAT repeat protein
LRSLDRQREKEAFQALEQGGLEAVPVLIRAMDEYDSTCVQAGQMIKAHGQTAVPFLTQALKNSRDSTVRANACRLLLELGPVAKAAMPALIEAARKDENDYVRFLAASAAYVIDPEQESAAGLPSPPKSNEPPQRQ